MKTKSIIVWFIIMSIILNLLIPLNSKAAKSSEDNDGNSGSDLIEGMLDGDKESTKITDFFDEDITFEREYISDGETMPYALYTPSTASDSVQMPLIVWLHGSGERNVSESTFFDRGLPKVLNNWTLEGFNAYIICPHLAANGYNWSWNNPTSANNLEKLLDKFITEHNIDTDNIIITGHSLGGQGAQYMAHEMPNLFSKMVVLSGYSSGIDVADIKIPTIGYVGTTAAGEDIYSVRYMHNTFASVFGKENTISLSTSHGYIPRIAFNKDDDGNNRSDLIEWMFEGYTMQGTSGSTNNLNSSKDKNDGGDLLVGMAQLMCFIPDSVINLCQWMFLNDEQIEEEGAYNIYYSPAAIFSGTIPAFDVNFISPNEKKTDNSGVADYIIENEETYRVAQSVDSDVYNQKLNDIKSRGYDGIIPGREYMYSDDYRQTIQYDLYYYIDDKSTEETSDDILVVETFGQYGVKAFGEVVGRSVYGKHETPMNSEALVKNSDIYESTARVLQSTIATFYNALRRIALVGLLSALVYIGIRIVLTSTSAKDKAKYKNMLKDWLIALCILFTLHYIMSITVTVVENINEVVKASTIGANGEDVMMTKLRNDIASGNDWGEVLVQVVLYFVLAVYIIIFTIQYIRRTIYLAFLTVISPLITLTYPLDKIKDGKSQAFDMWIKDYVFFSLLQVVHLLIYYILVGSAIDLADERNWIFAIVAIGFLIPAEKIIKKMFGFEKSKSMGALAAGATGALVMNAINKIKPKGGGKSAEKESSSTNNVRTASNDVLASLRAGASSMGGAGETGLASASVNSGGNGWKGAGAVAGKYGTRAIKGVMKGTAKGFVGATGAMIGFASGVAQGDISAALTGAVAGGKAGSSLAGAGINMAKNIPGGIKNTINDVTDTWNQGAYGAQQAQSMKDLRDFKSSSAYKSLKGTFGDDLTDDKVSAMLDAGIKEKGDMEKVLSSGNVSDAIGYYSLAKKCPDDIYYDDQKLQMYLEDLGISQTNAKTMRDNMRKFR